jgi:predicted MPP superfamily phosphohydrolase
MAALFNGLDITVLNDEVRRLPLANGDLYLVGVADLEWTRGRQGDAAVLKRLAQSVPPGAYTLLLYHTPDLIETASGAGINLYLAGHTHGGQIRLPFYGALITFSAYGRRYQMGRYTVGPTTLYVSRGIGMEGLSLPRVRFLCPPEVDVISLAVNP